MPHLATSSAVLCLLFILMAGSAPVHAHYPWLTIIEEDPLRFEVGWGHHFPREGILKAERIESVTLVRPDGSAAAIPLSTEGAHTAGSLTAPGTHIVAAVQVPGFYSRTPQGGRSGSRAEFPDALSCSHSANTMKTLISRTAGGDPGRVLGHTLEILPLADPAAVKAGDEFPVRVLFRGKPFRGTVEATWDGHPRKEEYAVTTRTDEEGTARIPLAQEGLWIVKVNTREPFPDAAVCDQESHTATLTFRIR